MMFQEIKNLRKITTQFLTNRDPSIEDLSLLLKMELVELDTIIDYLGFCVQKSISSIGLSEQEIIDILLMNNIDVKWKILGCLPAKNKNKLKPNNAFKISLQWLLESHQLRELDQFDVVEVLHDLLVFFSFPEYETKKLSLSFTDYEKTMSSIEEYIKIS